MRGRGEPQREGTGAGRSQVSGGLRAQPPVVGWWNVTRKSGACRCVGAGSRPPWSGLEWGLDPMKQEGSGREGLASTALGAGAGGGGGGWGEYPCAPGEAGGMEAGVGWQERASARPGSLRGGPACDGPQWWPRGSHGRVAPGGAAAGLGVLRFGSANS